MRCVFDTNILVSALLFKTSTPNRAFRYGLRNGEILLSIETLEELREVLNRKKFDRYVDKNDRAQFLEELLVRSLLVTVTETIQVCRDPKDDKFLELAVRGKADYIISGDRDLLVLNPERTTLWLEMLVALGLEVATVTVYSNCCLRTVNLTEFL